MRRDLLAMLVSVMLVCSVGHVSGKECHGITFPEQTSVQNSTLVLNGLGLRQATMVKVNVYVAALYVAQKSADANAILAAFQEVKPKVPFVVRLEGTNVEQGRKILADSGLNITTATGMTDAAKKVVAVVK